MVVKMESDCRSEAPGPEASDPIWLYDFERVARRMELWPPVHGPRATLYQRPRPLQNGEGLWHDGTMGQWDHGTVERWNGGTVKRPHYWGSGVYSVVKQKPLSLSARARTMQYPAAEGWPGSDWQNGGTLGDDTVQHRWCTEVYS